MWADSASEKSLRAIGFWRSSEDPWTWVRYPHPRELIDESWREQERFRVGEYLDHGVSIRGYMGFSHCRFSDGGEEDPVPVGTDDLTDGVWLWPEGLSRYVTQYSVRLPTAFIHTAMTSPFADSQKLDIPRLRGFRYSFKEWERFVRSRRSNRLLAYLSCFI